MAERTATILVVDDDKLVLDSMVKILKRAGYEVLSASNGKIALDAFRKYQPDLVITDIIMPDMDGIEEIRTLRKEAPDLKIIAMSAGSRSLDKSYCLDLARVMKVHTLEKSLEMDRNTILKTVKNILTT